MPKLKDLPFLSLTDDEKRAAVTAFTMQQHPKATITIGFDELPEQDADTVRLALHHVMGELDQRDPMRLCMTGAHVKLIQAQAIYAQAPKPDRGEDPVYLQVQVSDAEIVARALLRQADWIDAVNEVTPGPNARTISERLRYYGQDILDALAERDQGQ